MGPRRHRKLTCPCGQAVGGIRPSESAPCLRLRLHPLACCDNVVYPRPASPLVQSHATPGPGVVQCYCCYCRPKARRSHPVQYSAAQYSEPTSAGAWSCECTNQYKRDPRCCTAGLPPRASDSESRRPAARYFGGPSRSTQPYMW
jgi:hypothetical protein